MKLALVLTVFLVGTSLMAAETYPRTDLFVESTGLASASSHFVIFDARDRAKYEQGHIPNARWVDHATWAKAVQDGKDVDGWSKKIADLGIASDSKIVVYDDDWNKEAARIWWILKYWGVADVRLLNGGWKSGLLHRCQCKRALHPLRL